MAHAAPLGEARELMGRYWRVEARAKAEALYEEALRMRAEESRLPDGAGAKERLRKARFAITDRAFALERKAKRRAS